MSAPALELVDVRKDFGKTSIIRGVNLRVEKGERHAIIGPNGAGKSTLFNLISGRLSPSSGQIRLNGKDITGARPFEINRRGLARSFQVTNIFPKLSVFENVRCGVLWAAGGGYSFWQRVDSVPGVNERTEKVLSDLGLGHKRDLPAGVLTYAEQRALEIGVSIVGGADVIMLDEPTAGMSHSETEQVVELVRRISEGRTLVMVEHDMSVVFGLADRISVLVYGEVIASDTPERIRANPQVREAYLGRVEEAEANQ